MISAALRGGCRRFWSRAVVFLEMVKISHSIFALPFALSALFLAARGLPSLVTMLQVVLSCVFARTAAMAFNRWADAAIDARNPRTRGRAIPAGLLPRRWAGHSVLAASGAFILTTYSINRLAFALSPVALAVLLGYSYTKRFTQLSHLALGLALGLSPLGAWIAVTGGLALLPILLGGAVLCWTAGFDIIYACQDLEFDRAEGLRSIPARWGIGPSLWISRALHAAAVALLAWVGILGELGWPYAAGVILVAALLAYEQSLVRPRDLSRVGQAFFLVNGLVSLAFLAAVIVEVLV